MGKAMLASRLHKIGTKLILDRVPIPNIGSQEVLVDVKAAGICHSDLNYRNGIAPVRKLPITLGHEIAGVVNKTGSRVTRVHVGDRVLVHYVISCGTCIYCRHGQENYCTRYQMIGKDVDGGFAEFVKVPARSLLKLPKTIPFEQAAIMGCAVPTAYHALKRARVKGGDTVVVFGVGGLGIHAVQLAKKVFGAGLIIAVDIYAWKLDHARRFGAKTTINAASHDVANVVRKVTDGKLSNVVLDFVGREDSIQNAIESTGKGGRMVLVGIGADSMQISPYRTLIGKEMEVIGVDDHLGTELTELISLVRSGKIDLSESVTHTVPLSQVSQGLQLLAANHGKVIRIVAAKGS